MRKLTRRLDRLFRELITWRRIIVVTMGIILGLGLWSMLLSLARGTIQIGGLGIGGYTEPVGIIQRGGSIWDWLDILLLPATLLLIAYLGIKTYTHLQVQDAEHARENELHVAELARLNEKSIAIEAQKEAILQAYLEKTADYLSFQGTRTTKSKANLNGRKVAQLRTITAIRTLDQSRVNILFQFLRDSELAEQLLEGAPLQHVDMEEVNLSESNLDCADLSWASLKRASLLQSSLHGARLYNANLTKALLIECDLSNADLTMADLTEANLSQGNLQEVNLCQANLNCTNLSGVNLVKADLQGADLLNADLSGADLTGAQVTESQLLEAKSLVNAVLPDGKIYIDGQAIIPGTEKDQAKINQLLELPTNVWMGDKSDNGGNGHEPGRKSSKDKASEEEVSAS